MSFNSDVAEAVMTNELLRLRHQKMIMRQGRRVGRTLYWQQGEEPSDSDPVIGLVDYPQIAAAVVRAFNALPLADRADALRP